MCKTPQLVVCGFDGNVVQLFSESYYKQKVKFQKVCTKGCKRKKCATLWIHDLLHGLKLCSENDLTYPIIWLDMLNRTVRIFLKVFRH